MEAFALARVCLAEMCVSPARNTSPMARTAIRRHIGRRRWTRAAPSRACTHTPERIDERTAHRPIRSFVVRAGRMTAGQTRALENSGRATAWSIRPRRCPSTAVFGRLAPRTLEIGFGNGEHLASLATAHPERDYFGIEVHRPGVGHLLHARGKRRSRQCARRARTTRSKCCATRSRRARSTKCSCCFRIRGTRSGITSAG